MHSYPLGGAIEARANVTVVASVSQAFLIWNFPQLAGQTEK
jgi:hypothetical protein